MYLAVPGLEFFQYQRISTTESTLVNHINKDEGYCLCAGRNKACSYRTTSLYKRTGVSTYCPSPCSTCAGFRNRNLVITCINSYYDRVSRSCSPGINKRK